MVGQRDDWSFPEQSTSLCVIPVGHKWMYQMVSAPLRRVRCIRGFRASRDRFKEARAGDRTPLQGSIFGLGLTSKCVVTRTVNLKAGFFLKRFYWSRQKKRDTFTVSVQWRDSSPAVHKTTGSLDEQHNCGFIVSSEAGFGTWLLWREQEWGDTYLWPAGCPRWPRTSGTDGPSARCNQFHRGWAHSSHTGCGHSYRRLQGKRPQILDMRIKQTHSRGLFFKLCNYPPPLPQCSLTHLLMISRSCMPLYWDIFQFHHACLAQY